MQEPSTPEHFLCPISLEIMHDPVICCDGVTYERKHILRWLEQHDTSFKTNVALENRMLISNYAFKSGIAKYLNEYQNAASSQLLVKK